jgi:thiosulfate/3-mercaptopyruvate sulfurtransferase
MGIGPGMQVVAYDDQGGSLAAVRLWWMLRWLGHDAVAVLDGGWQGWLSEDLPLRGGRETRSPQTFIARPRQGMYLTTQQVERLQRNPSYRVIDVRAPERYRGEVEPIDLVAGHIPGAINAPYTDNLNAEGKFRAPEELRTYYQALLGETPAERTVFYCGSGVTSIHSVLAMLIAGMGEAKLYAGSWSEWIADRRRPVALTFSSLNIVVENVAFMEYLLNRFLTSIFVNYDSIFYVGMTSYTTQQFSVAIILYPIQQLKVH